MEPIFHWINIMVLEFALTPPPTWIDRFNNNPVKCVHSLQFKRELSLDRGEQMQLESIDGQPPTARVAFAFRDDGIYWVINRQLYNSHTDLVTVEDAIECLDQWVSSGYPEVNRLIERHDFREASVQKWRLRNEAKLKDFLQSQGWDEMDDDRRAVAWSMIIGNAELSWDTIRDCALKIADHRIAMRRPSSFDWSEHQRRWACEHDLRSRLAKSVQPVSRTNGATLEILSLKHDGFQIKSEHFSRLLQPGFVWPVFLQESSSPMLLHLNTEMEGLLVDSVAGDILVFGTRMVKEFADLKNIDI